jgi:hypothetical protein
MRSWPVLLVLALAGAPVVTAGCGTDAHGVDTCKQIEEARCRAADADKCSVIQSPPPYYSNGSPVDACIRYYDVACLHGLAVSNDPHPSDVAACVKAINSGKCSIVEDPTTSSACSWLSPTPVEAGAEAEAGEAGDASDAGDEMVIFPDGF